MIFLFYQSHIPFLFSCFQQLVESVLNKVVEEFEHCIASQHEMVCWFYQIFEPKNLLRAIEGIKLTIIWLPINLMHS